MFVFRDHPEQISIADTRHSPGIDSDPSEIGASHAGQHGKGVKEQAVDVECLRPGHAFPVTGREKKNNRNKPDHDSQGN